MFFIFGITNGEKKLDFNQTMICSRCGQFGRMELFMTYMFFSLFFIPVFSWGRRYFIKSSCCGTVYTIDRELGRRLQRGERVNLTEEDLHAVNGRGPGFNGRCPACNYPLTPEFEYCPKCGRKL